MKARALLLLRVTLGGLLIWWGLDKLVHVEHGVAVAEQFYWGVGTGPGWLRVAGVLEMVLGGLVVVGLGRRWAYPALVVVTGVTLLGVWRSVLDPWGWVLADTNVLFYPSAIVWAASLVLWTFRNDDRLTLDRQPTTTQQPPENHMGRLLLLSLLLACSATPPTAPDADPIPEESAPPPGAEPIPEESAPPPGAAPLQGRFSGLAGHRATGAVSFRLADGVGEIRLGDDFSSSPVPDPHVYVATQPDANRGTRLRIALLQRSAGSQTYTFRLDGAVAYQYVLVWCDRYNVGVGAARLQ